MFQWWGRCRLGATCHFECVEKIEIERRLAESSEWDVLSGMKDLPNATATTEFGDHGDDRDGHRESDDPEPDVPGRSELEVLIHLSRHGTRVFERPTPSGSHQFAESIGQRRLTGAVEGDEPTRPEKVRPVIEPSPVIRPASPPGLKLVENLAAGGIELPPRPPTGSDLDPRMRVRFTDDVHPERVVVFDRDETRDHSAFDSQRLAEPRQTGGEVLAMAESKLGEKGENWIDASALHESAQVEGVPKILSPKISGEGLGDLPIPTPSVGLGRIGQRLEQRGRLRPKNPFRFLSNARHVEDRRANRWNRITGDRLDGLG